MKSARLVGLHRVGSVTAVCAAITGGASGSEITVSPATDLAALVERSPAGTSFVLLPGKHYSGEIRPKDHQTFVGMTGAILSGAVRLGPFISSGSQWKTQGPPPLPPSSGSCGRRPATGSEECLLREAVFVDELPLARVSVLAELREGTWYQDRKNGEIYLSSDPGTRVVEMSYRPVAIYGPAHDVTIRGLTIEHYANPAQRGAIQGYDPTDRVSSTTWTVADNVIRYNSGTGIRTADLMVVRSNRIFANGQLGIGGFGDRVLVEANEISDNNTHGFSAAWEAGGTKFVRTKDLIFIDNCVRGNKGHGIWTDIENVDSVIVNNEAINNAGAGIFHEISGRALIANNLSAFNGSDGNSPWSSQILVSGSIDTLVWQNRVEVGPNYGHGIFVVEEGRVNKEQRIHNLPEYVSRGDVVMQNRVIFNGTAGVSGLSSTRGNAYDLASANRFEDNEIVVRQGDLRRFRIGDETMDLAAARDHGQELRSRVVSKVHFTDNVDLPVCRSGRQRSIPTSPN